MTKSGSHNVKLAAAAVPGCQHALNGGAICQDAAKVRLQDDIAVLAVADGHGDAAHPRSDRGAAIAVNVAVDVLLDALRKEIDGDRLIRSTTRHEELFKHVRRKLAWEWNRQVKLDAMLFDAIADPETKELSISGDEDGAWEKDVTRLYGTTLLAAAFTPDIGVLFQLGDGEIVLVGDDGQGRRAFDVSEKTYTQATNSMCAEDWIRHGKMEIIDRDVTPICMAMLNTDGVVDPFVPPGRYEKVWGTHYLDAIHADNWEGTITALTERLSKISQTSGDDVSAAVAYWPDVPLKKAASKQSEIRRQQLAELAAFEEAMRNCLGQTKMLRESPNYLDDKNQLVKLGERYQNITRQLPSVVKHQFAQAYQPRVDDELYAAPESDPARPIAPPGQKFAQSAEDLEILDDDRDN